ncbi:MAG: DUF6142 family protein [Hespellia sp.]|nr:DUF6142 family protein [Hespellia sp.]
MQIGKQKESSLSVSKLRDRKNKKNRRYGQAPKKHAKMGIDSCIYAGITALVLILAILIAYLARGTSAVYIGIMGLLAMASAGRGVYDAVKGFREREKNYITCKVGMGINIFFLICLVLIYIGGLL